MKQLESLAKNILKRLDIVPNKINLKKTEIDETYQLTLELDENDTAILIGYHGDTIAALQLILGLMLFQKSGQWSRVIVDIGDYRQKRRKSLEQMAEETVKRVKFSGEPIALFNLNSFERRVIHLYLKDNPDVLSESEGEGIHRHLIVSLKDSTKVETPPLPEEDDSNI